MLDQFRNDFEELARAARDGFFQFGIKPDNATLIVQPPSDRLARYVHVSSAYRIAGVLHEDSRTVDLCQTAASPPIQAAEHFHNTKLADVDARMHHAGEMLARSLLDTVKVARAQNQVGVDFSGVFRVDRALTPADYVVY